MQVSVCSDVGRVRKVNQDSYCALTLSEGDQTAFFAVADGMGGYQGGEVASQLAIDTVGQFVAEHWQEWGSADRALDGLRAAVERANAAIISAQQDPQQAGMGTTFTAVLVQGETMFVAHIGDSRLYALGAAHVHQITDDHSVVGELLRAGSLTEAEAMVHPQRHLLTSALGSQTGAHVDVSAQGWNAGDVLLLCSDGLSNLITAEELLQTLQSSPDFSGYAARLVELANQRGGPDNITVLAVSREGAQ